MSAALPAFLFEAIFYLGSVYEETRNWFASLRPVRMQSALLWLSAIIPYLIFSLSAGTFQRNAFYLLAVLTGILAFWYVLLPRRPAYDFGFLVLAAAPVLLRVFSRVYLSPEPRVLPIEVLGHLTWLRLGIAALLIVRGWNPGSFGFWPQAREWRTGIFYYLLSVAPIILLALWLHDVRFAPIHGDWWRVAAVAIGTFFGALWVIALSEELFFRGVIARAALNEWRSPAVAVLISAALFGSAHLWVHDFPNWRRAAVTTLLGLACGIAYTQSGSVRVPMVTHAFVVTTWRVFFK